MGLDADTYAWIASKMRKRAQMGVTNGRVNTQNTAYINACRRIHDGTTIIFTRDTGHHTSGWFKNPDYERCWHLSTSATPGWLWTPGTRDLDSQVLEAWLKAFFGDDRRYLWAEGPHSKRAKEIGVWHWRLFCDPSWKPFLPRGEVYDTELTELGWKSSSEMGITIESTLTPG